MKKLFTLLAVTFFLTIPQVSAQFSSSGSTITQTGTANITSGSSISGTTTFTKNRVTVFDFGNKTLVVNGTINIAEGAAFHNVQISSSSPGTLNLGTPESNPIDYNYNSNVKMLRVNNQIIASPIVINSYGQFIDLQHFDYTSPIRWEHSRVTIDGRFNALGGGVIIGSAINTLGAFPNANFVFSNYSQFSGNTILAADYFSLSYGTPDGTYNFSNINLRTGQGLVSHGKNSAGVILDIINVSSGENYSLNGLASDRNYVLRLSHKINQTVLNSNFNAVEGAAVYVVGDAGETEIGTTDSSGEDSITYQYHTNTITAGSENKTSRITNNELRKRVLSYLYNTSAEEVISVALGEDYNSEVILSNDPNITEVTRATVDGYTTIDNLDQLYDRAKSWKVTTANIEYPTIGTQPVTGDGTVLDLGNRNILIDASAGSAFAINTVANTITIKSTAALVAGTKFNSIRTTGTVSTAGGASLEFGYEDATGINKYVALSNLSNTDTVLIRDNISGADIVSVTGITGDYKAHFIAPADASDITVSVTRPSHSSFTENYPETDLSFVRAINLQLTNVIAETQIEMLNLVMKVLQKEEAIYRALDLTNPTLTVTNTISGATGTPTEANQLAILEILNKVFVKVIANRRKLE